MSLIAGRSVLFALSFVALVAAKPASAAEPTPAEPTPAELAVAAAPTATTAPQPPASSPKRRSLAPDIAPLALENPNVSLRVGLLLQPQYQMLGENTFTGQGENLYVRRARLIVGGSMFGVLDYFFDTDYPNLFLGQAVSGAPSVKYTPTMDIQDAFVTYRPFGHVLMVDAGYMLPPMAHNAVQSAATLFGWDYFKYTFQHDQVFGAQPLTTSPAGRDAGFELRGLVLGEHLEYRLGMFQGLRAPKTTTETGAQNNFRITGRLQINFLDSEPGFFYAGTYLGARQILSIGGSYDLESSLTKDYQYYAADAFLDLPVGPGVVTAQLNVAHWNGHDFIPMVIVPGQIGQVLESQTAVMAEAGFTFFDAKLSPILRFEHLQGPALPAQNRYAGGVAFWPFGHNFNLKAFYTRITQDALPPPSAVVHGADQFNLQLQVYFY